MSTIAAVCLIIIAGALCTRLGKLHLALRLLQVGNALQDAGSRVLDGVKREHRP